jgi:hypothetical protein
MTAPPTVAPRSASRIVVRLALGHVAAYPLAFLWAVAAIPLTIHVFHGDIDASGGDPAVFARLVVVRLAWPAAAVFLVEHAVAIAWALGRDPARATRRFAWGTGALAAVGVVLGGASWAWLWLR